MDLEQKGQFKFLYLDLECRPGHWISGDYVSKVLTAGAFAMGKGPVKVYSHYQYSPVFLASILANKLRTPGIIVVGHYVRGFDLPLLNGELLRNSMEPLGSVLTLDTKLDLMKAHGRSLSQKNLAAQLELNRPKVDLTLYEWEAFNGREPWARVKGERRVAGDVRQNREMHLALVDLGWLGTPKMWRPDAGTKVRYSG